MAATTVGAVIEVVVPPDVRAGPFGTELLTVMNPAGVYGAAPTEVGLAERSMLSNPPLVRTNRNRPSAEMAMLWNPLRAPEGSPIVSVSVHEEVFRMSI